MKKIIISAILAIATVILAACGNDKPSEISASQDTPEAIIKRVLTAASEGRNAAIETELEGMKRVPELQKSTSDKDIQRFFQSRSEYLVNMAKNHGGLQNFQVSLKATNKQGDREIADVNVVLNYKDKTVKATLNTMKIADSPWFFVLPVL